MRQHSPATAHLLEIVQALVAQHRDLATPTDDIVHFDFQPSNILAMPDKISGVVDWDGACAGDRAFDLATLLFYVYDQDAPRDALWRRLGEIAEPRATTIYLAHLIHRQVDWSIRRHLPETVDQWLERARVVLQDLPARTGYDVPTWP
jgi:aminoglycoside phosphotransferase (APT) family kinase protein